MQKLLLFASALLIGGAYLSDIQAQDKVTWGIRGGLNISNIGGNIKDDDHWGGNHISFPAKVGFNLGVIADIELGKSFYLQPGFYYSNKGFKYKWENDGEKEIDKFGLNYFEIPILASYKLNINDNLRWEINAGPYIAVGIAGKDKYKYSGEDPDYSYSVPAFGTGKTEVEDSEGDKFDTYKRGLKRFDFGLQFATGLTIKEHYYVGLRYDLGLLNGCNTSDEESPFYIDHDSLQQWGVDIDDYVGKLRNFSICFGYNF